jgi:hypothetical protein
MTPDELRVASPRSDLTALTTKEAESIWPIVSDPALSSHMSWNTRRNKDETLAFLKRIESDFAPGKGITWAIFSMVEFCGIFHHRHYYYLTGPLGPSAEKSPIGGRWGARIHD